MGIVKKLDGKTYSLVKFSNGLWTFYDEDKRKPLRQRFKYVSMPAYHNWAAVMFKNGKQGLFNAKTKDTIKSNGEFDVLSSPSYDGYSVIKSKDGRYNFLNVDREMRSAYYFKKIIAIQNQWFQVQLDNNRWTFYNPPRNILCALSFLACQYIGDDWAKVQLDDGRWSFYNMETDDFFVKSFVWVDAEVSNDWVMIELDNGKRTLANLYTKKILDENFEVLSAPTEDGLVKVIVTEVDEGTKTQTHNGLYAYYDVNNQKLLDYRTTEYTEEIYSWEDLCNRYPEAFKDLPSTFFKKFPYKYADVKECIGLHLGRKAKEPSSTKDFEEYTKRIIKLVQDKILEEKPCDTFENAKKRKEIANQASEKLENMY